LAYNDDPDEFLNEINELKQKTANKQKQQVFGRAYIFNFYLAACDKYEQLNRLGKLPEDIYCVAYHRRFVRKSNPFFHEFAPQLLSSPILMVLPIKPTGRRIYEEVWSIAHKILRKDSKYLKKSNLWWNQKNWRELMMSEKGKQGNLKPFVLKTVDRQGFSCSQCNWVQKCSGCVIEPNEGLQIKDFLKKCHLAIEWQSQMIEEEYNPTSNEIMRHPTIFSFEDDPDEQIISLENCLKKYHEVEKLSDEIYCNKCQKHRDHSKSFETFRPPPILTI